MDLPAPSSDTRAPHRKETWVIAALCLLVAATVLGAYAASVASQPDEVKLGYVPDDGFYYLVLARNHGSLGLWSFDDGTTTTSGFHPLFALLLERWPGIVGAPPGRALRTAVLLSAALTALALLLSAVLCVVRRWPYALMVLALLAASRQSLTLSVAVVEWPLVLLAVVLYLMALLALPTGRRQSLALFVCGALGSWARSDFGLLPLTIATSALLLALLTGSSWRQRLAGPLMGLLGASLGVLSTMAYHAANSGQWLQSSALMKVWWSEFERAGLGALLGSDW